eukprot:756886-Hanusia_phi.AAC.1
MQITKTAATLLVGDGQEAAVVDMQPRLEGGGQQQADGSDGGGRQGAVRVKCTFSSACVIESSSCSSATFSSVDKSVRCDRQEEEGSLRKQECRSEDCRSYNEI